MEYASADPSVIKSIRQRVLLDAWLRALRKPRKLPVLIDFDPEIGIEELADMMGFDVVGNREAARFWITQEGARLTEAYGKPQASGVGEVYDPIPVRANCIGKRMTERTGFLIDDADAVALDGGERRQHPHLPQQNESRHEYHGGRHHHR